MDFIHKWLYGHRPELYGLYCENFRFFFMWALFIVILRTSHNEDVPIQEDLYNLFSRVNLDVCFECNVWEWSVQTHFKLL